MSVDPRFKPLRSSYVQEFRFAPQSHDMASAGDDRDNQFAPPARTLSQSSDATQLSQDIQTTFHGHCRKCLHHHDGTAIFIHLSRRASFPNTISCEKCGDRLFGLGGRRTRFSLVSRETLSSYRSSSDQSPPSLTSQHRLPFGKNYRPNNPSGLATVESNQDVASLPDVDNHLSALSASSADKPPSSPLDAGPDTDLRLDTVKQAKGGSRVSRLFANSKQAFRRGASRNLISRAWDRVRRLSRRHRKGTRDQPTAAGLGHHYVKPDTDNQSLRSGPVDPSASGRSIADAGYRDTPHQDRSHGSPKPSSYFVGSLEDAPGALVEPGFGANEERKRLYRALKTDQARRKTRCTCPPNCECCNSSAHGRNISFTSNEVQTGSHGRRHSRTISDQSSNRAPSPAPANWIGHMGEWIPPAAGSSGFIPIGAHDDRRRHSVATTATGPSIELVGYPPCPSPPTSTSLLTSLQSRPLSLVTDGLSSLRRQSIAGDQYALPEEEEVMVVEEEEEEVHDDSAVEMGTPSPSFVGHAATWPPMHTPCNAHRGSV